MKVRSIFSQPSFRRFIVGHGLVHEGPEVGAVVHFFEVGNLVGGDVVEDLCWAEDEAPGI